MRLMTFTLGAALSAAAIAQTPPELLRCAQTKDAHACAVSRREIRDAKKEFARGMKLRQAGKMDDALAAFEWAASLVPRDMEYLTAREIARQQLVLRQLKTGNDLLAQHHNVEAAGAFQRAVQLDSSNSFALQRLRDSLGENIPSKLAQLRLIEQSDTLQVAPRPGLRSFHFRGDSRQIMEQVTSAFGIKAVFDDSVQPKQLRFDLEEADFNTAMNLVSLMSKTFWTPISADQVLVAADRPQERQQFERMALRTFYLPNALTPQELNDVVNLFRTVFEVRFITQNPAASTITVRAPQRILQAATSFLESLDSSRPQVMLEMQVFEINDSMLRTLGLDLPLQWSAFNLGSQALALLQQSNIQSLINQLIASGGINQANTTAISALLAQLQGQQNSLLKQPFGTFGGGSTLFAVPFPPATANFSLNEARVTSLEHLTLRASQGTPATMRIGSRYPILNAIFSPIFNTPAISQVIQTQGFQAPFPSFNYEDLGITVKATPLVHGTSEVTLQLEMAIKSLSSQSINGVPVIGNREYKGSLRVLNGESGVVVGMLDQSEQNALQGIPGISSIPGVHQVVSKRTKQVTSMELLVLITPHIVRSQDAGEKAIWLRGGAQ